MTEIVIYLPIVVTGFMSNPRISVLINIQFIILFNNIFNDI